jgi:regulator of replication initiation timing
MRADLAKAATATQAKQQSLGATGESPDEQMLEVIEENQRLREENEALQQKLAELSLQIAAVSQITVGGSREQGGLKVKASRLDGLC